MLQTGLEVKIYDTPAGGIRASQGTFSSFIVSKSLLLLFPVGEGCGYK